MKKNKLINLDSKVSEICIGTNNFFSQKLKSENDIFNLLNTSLRYGINFFDTAESYSNGKCESILGKYISKNVSQTAGTLDREQNPVLDTVDKNRVLVKY